jgi:DNA-directed RNA polymerase subunit RPC12/RpoP
MMDALDGNAIAGLLHDVFSAEMTTATGTCGTCGRSTILAQLLVYLQAPGTVVRCPACGNVMMVFVRRQARTCVDLSGLADLAD